MIKNKGLNAKFIFKKRIKDASSLVKHNRGNPSILFIWFLCKIFLLYETFNYLLKNRRTDPYMIAYTYWDQFDNLGFEIYSWYKTRCDIYLNNHSINYCYILTVNSYIALSVPMNLSIVSA